MKSRVGAGLLLAAFVFSQVAHAECSKDTDCKGDRICINGACVDPPALGQPPPPPPLPPGQAPPEALPPGAVVPGPPPAAAALPPPAVEPPPAPGPEPGTVPVTFRGGDGYVVRSTTRSGHVVQCTSPCTLRLFPGQVEVEVVGQFTDTIMVPNRPAAADISFRRKGIMIAGIVLVGVSLGALAFGAMMKASYDDCKAREDQRGTVYYETCTGKAESTMMYTIGAVLGAVGIGLFIPGVVSKSAVTMNDESIARSLLRSWNFGVAPRREGGGFFTARYAF